MSATNNFNRSGVDGLIIREKLPGRDYVMLVQLSINNTELPAFMNIIEHLRSGIVDSVTVLDPAEASFVVSTNDMVRERVEFAEKRGAYTDHDTFWKDI
jgi:hypothetical protein